MLASLFFLFFLFFVLFSAPVYGVICPLVGLSVSENSSLAPCGCVMAGTSHGLGGPLTINVLCQKWRLLGGVLLCCTGKDVGVDALSIYGQSVVDMRGVCLHGLGVFLSLKLKWWLLSTTENTMDSRVRWWR